MHVTKAATFQNTSVATGKQRTYSDTRQRISAAEVYLIRFVVPPIWSPIRFALCVANSDVVWPCAVPVRGTTLHA